jgi:hypothetical protein
MKSSGAEGAKRPEAKSKHPDNVSSAMPLREFYPDISTFAMLNWLETAETTDGAETGPAR